MSQTVRLCRSIIILYSSKELNEKWKKKGHGRHSATCPRLGKIMWTYACVQRLGILLGSRQRGRRVVLHSLYSEGLSASLLQLANSRRLDHGAQHVDVLQRAPAELDWTGTGQTMLYLYL